MGGTPKERKEVADELDGAQRMAQTAVCRLISEGRRGHAMWHNRVPGVKQILSQIVISGVVWSGGLHGSQLYIIARW